MFVILFMLMPLRKVLIPLFSPSPAWASVHNTQTLWLKGALTWLGAPEKWVSDIFYE